MHFDKTLVRTLIFLPSTGSDDQNYGDDAHTMSKVCVAKGLFRIKIKSYLFLIGYRLADVKTMTLKPLMSCPAIETGWYWR